MSLKSRIEDTQDTIKRQHEVVVEVRRNLWQAEWKRKNDKKWEGESLKHWRARRKRNKQRRNKRDDILKRELKKLEALEKLLDNLREKRQEYQEAQAEDKSVYDQGSTSIVTFDGKPLVEDLAYWLDKARKNGWNGYLVSGYRTPEYSEQLCYNMCGAPSCPGMCAGRASNHAKLTYPGPAADVTDYINCERVLYQIGAPYSNNLPRDLVHMSRSGQ